MLPLGWRTLRWRRIARWSHPSQRACCELGWPTWKNPTTSSTSCGCALGPGLGASLFNVAAAVALASALNQDEGGTLVRDGLGQALQALQVLLPLTWCFRGSDQLCTDGGKEEVEEVRREGRVSYRESWLASFRRSDKFGDLRVTQVSCSRFKHRCASMISPRY